MTRRILAKTGWVVGNLDELPDYPTLPVAERTPDSLHIIYRENNENVKHILHQLKKRLRELQIEVGGNVNFPYQTLVTSGSNLGSGIMHGSTKTQSVLTTKSDSPEEFDWRCSKRARSSLVVVGPGDGVEPHFFMVNPDPQYSGPIWGKDINGNEVQRAGLVMPYGAGTDLQLIFFKFDTTDGYKPKPMNLGLGTTVYLEQRLPGE